MFMDTPKLQPISKSKPKPNDNNVPSVSSNNNNNNASNTSGSINKNKDGTSIGESYVNTNKDNRCNYGSYRSNNFQNQNYQKNYQNREYNKFQSNNFNPSNKFKTYWSNTWTNRKYNNWNTNNNYNHKNFRNNNFTANRYNERETFAKDIFQFKNCNNEIANEKPESEIVKDTKPIKTTSKNNIKITTPKSKIPNNKNITITNNVTVKQNKLPQNQKPVIPNNFQKDKRKNPNTKNLVNKKSAKTTRTGESSKNVKKSGETQTKATKSNKNCKKLVTEKRSTKDNSISINKVIANEVNCGITNEKQNVNDENTKTEELKLNKRDNLDVNTSSAIALNANVLDTQTEKEFLNSCAAEELNSTAFTAKHSNNNFIELLNNDLTKKNLKLKETLQQPPTVLQPVRETPLLSPTETQSASAITSNSLSENENFEFHVPKISLIPISRLIATEFWETSTHESLAPESSKPQSTANTNTSHKQLFKPNLIKRKRNVSTCSNSSSSSQTNSATDRLVEKLVTMNKINLKNIINTSDTKYDEALKTQARKRLREEIRRQLKSMNIEPPKDPICTDFVPDEIVDSIDIPDVVFEEIRKALGLELFNYSDDINIRTIEEIFSSTNAEGNDNIRDSYIPQPPPQVSEDLFTLIPQEFIQQPIAKETPAPPRPPVISENVLTSSKTNNLTNPQKEAEEAKCEIKPDIKDRYRTQKSDKSPKKTEMRSKSKKLTKRKESRKSKRHRSPKRTKEDVVVLITSSSSSESSTSSFNSSSSTASSSSSSSSSSDSESDISAHSSGSVAKRRRLKLKVDAENVVDSFEKLILTSLSESLRDRYHSKYSNSVNTKLHFISCICTSDYNYGKFSKLQIAKVQNNLKSSDCSTALEFLMKEIVNVFNKQKQVAKQEDNRKSSRGHIEATKENSQELSPTKKNTHTNNEEPTKGKSSNGNTLKSSTSTCSPPTSTSSPSSAALKTKSVNAAQKVTTYTNGEKHIQECVTKVLSLYRQEMKAAMQSKESINQQPSTQKSTADEHQTRKEQPRTSINSSSSTTSIAAPSSTTIENKNAGNAKENDETNLPNPINPINQQQKPQQQTETELNNVNENLSKDNETQQQLIPLINGRQHNTPEERKCMNESLQFMQMPSFCSTDYSAVSSTLNNFSGSLIGVTSSSYNQQPSFPMVDLEALRKQSPIGEVVVNNLREIDVKLMEIHKRKMYIEEMILKLQKDKMEADLLTIKLQNEKFILLNTAMTANVTSTTAKNDSNISQKPELQPCSSVQNIKTETIILSDALSVTDKTPAIRKKGVKVRALGRKAPVNKKITISRKRKIPAITSTTKATIKKPRKEIKETAKQIPKTTSKATTETTRKLPTKTTKKCPVTKPPPKIAVENSPKYPKQITEINNNPTTINNRNLVADSTTKTTNYKNMPTGSLDGIRNPITQIRVFEEFIVASSEDGKLYKFDVATLKLLVQFSKHSEAITQMHLCRDKKVIYTTSLDGYLKKSSLENFALDIQSVYLQEPLQSIDIQWDLVYMGSRWGNIYTYDLATNNVSEKALCSTDSSIISIKATKEGSRKILIVSSKGNLIHLRDATSGILLRTFDVPESINIYSILLNDGIIYCGTQKKEIRKYDFMSGTNLGVLTCGNGAVSMRMYNNKYIFVGCYDGFIYILDKTTGKQMGRLAGSGKMILTLEIVEDKIITSAKDNTMKIADIPSYCLENNTAKTT